MRLIDADKLKDIISDTWILDRIDEQPTVDPIKHGHWEHGKELSRDYIGDVCVSVRYDKCWCSECRYQVEGFGLPLWMYCPHCGAKMDGKGKENGI